MHCMQCRQHRSVPVEYRRAFLPEGSKLEERNGRGFLVGTDPYYLLDGPVDATNRPHKVISNERDDTPLAPWLDSQMG